MIEITPSPFCSMFHVLGSGTVEQSVIYGTKSGTHMEQNSQSYSFTKD